MKALDVLGTGVKAAVAAAQKLVAPAKARSREAEEELRRRAEANARGDERRAAREAALLGSSRWLSHRPGWLERER